MASDVERFFSKFIKHENGCWIWSEYTGARGYGRFHYGGGYIGAHRFSYIIEHGSIGDGLVIDHLCRNPSCVNPEHLEAVTQKVNVARGNHFLACYGKIRVTHCKLGHEYTEENTYRTGRKRECRACRKRRGLERTKLKAIARGDMK